MCVMCLSGTVPQYKLNNLLVVSSVMHDNENGISSVSTNVTLNRFLEIFQSW